MNLSHVHIVNGLAEGDIVYLSPPEGEDVPELSTKALADGSRTASNTVDAVRSGGLRDHP